MSTLWGSVVSQLSTLDDRYSREHDRLRKELDSLARRIASAPPPAPGGGGTTSDAALDDYARTAQSFDKVLSQQKRSVQCMFSLS